MMCTYFVRRCWLLLFCKRLSPFPPICMFSLVCSITNGSARTHGAEDTVNGYMIFILYSVAFFARALSSVLSHGSWAVLDACPLSPVVRFIGSTMYMVIRLLVGE